MIGIEQTLFSLKAWYQLAYSCGAGGEVSDLSLVWLG